MVTPAGTKEASPEISRSLEELFRKAQPLLEKFDAAKQAEGSRWDQELAMLRRRVKTTTTLLPLPKGVYEEQEFIEIRVSFTENEEKRLAELIVGMAKNPEGVYELIEMVTANEQITAQWLKEHPDEFATQDFFEIIDGWFEERDRRRRERMERIRQIASFRPK